MFFNYTSYGARRVSLRGNYLHGKIIFFTVSNIAIFYIFASHVQDILSHVTKRIRVRFLDKIYLRTLKLREYTKSEE